MRSGCKVCEYVPFDYAPRSPMLYSIMCGNVPDVDPDQRLEPASRRADEGWSGESSCSRVLPVYDLVVRGNLFGVLLFRCRVCGLVATGSLPSAVFAHDVGCPQCRGEVELVADFRSARRFFAPVGESDNRSGKRAECAVAGAAVALDPAG
jgi:ssDNA thymidine ADP-ribosyltransferase, DarT